jgi:hypothetical protein
MFSLSLSKDHLRVEPGSAVTLAVVVHNRGDSADRYELDLTGLDGDWIAIPVPTFLLAPGEERTEKILIKPPRAAESKSGAYPFAVKVRSLESGEANEAPAVLDVEPFHLLSIEVEPKRGVAGFRKKQAAFAVTAINLGNTDQNLQMFADDPEDGCAYQFEHERIQLAPGQQKQVYLAVQPAQFPLIGANRLYGFAVSARSIENPLVVANAQAQVERHPLLSVPILLSVFAVFLIGLVWFTLRPKPATMDAFGSDVSEVVYGQQVRLNWSASNAKSVTIETQDGVFLQGLEPTGSKLITPTGTTTYTAYAVNDLGHSKNSLSLNIVVRQPEVVPEPEIDSFSVTPKEVNLGDTVKVRYKVSNAVRIQLQPMGIDLPTNLDSYDIRMEQPGSQTLTLYAYNAKNQAVTRSAPVIVAEKSAAKVIAFQAMMDGQPLGEKEVEPGATVTIEWQVAGASRVEIKPGIGAVSGDKGTIEVTVDKSSQYTLTAWDAAGLQTIQKLNIKVKVQPPPEGSPPPN